MENDIQTTLFRMRKAFIERLPQRLTILRILLANIERGQHDSLESLQRAAHSLQSSAAVHQLMRISEVAGNLERIVAAIAVDGVSDEQAMQAMRKALANLEAQVVKPGQGVVPQIPAGRTDSPRIAVVSDDKAQAGWLRSTLEQAGYTVEAFNDLADFAAASPATEPPSALIMDKLLPEGDDTSARIYGAQ